MRYETKHWYDLDFHLEIVLGGTGIGGATPEIAIFRVFDSKWYNQSTNAFDSTPKLHWGMVASTLGSALMPGLYHYECNAAAATRPNDEAQDGYIVLMEDSGNAVFEHVRIHVTNLPAWAEERADYTTVNTFGHGVLVHLCNPNSIVASSFNAGAIDAAAIDTDAINSSKIAASAIGSSELAAGAITASTFATDSITLDAATAAVEASWSNVSTISAGAIDAAAIATDAIDADAIATDALGALELGAGAATEIATAVWSDNLGNYTTAGKAAFDVHNILLGGFINAGATPNARHEATATGSAGKFYATTVPTPGGAAAGYLVGLSATLRTATAGALYKVSAVQNDGGGDYIQLVDSAGSTAITVTTNDFLLIQASQPSGLTAAGVWDEATSSHTTGGTFGDAVRRILCLRQENMRVVYTAWSATNVPTAGTVYIYDSKADMDADAAGLGTGSTGSYTFDATFNASLQPTAYSSGKVT